MEMAAVRLMVMYESESVDVHFVNGSSLYLSPCGSEFLLEKALPPCAHPLQGSERVRQRTRFAISEYKALLMDALKFRNKYATHPYLPEEFILTDQRKWFLENLSDIDWPADTPLETTIQPNGETILSSSDGNGRLILSPSGEDFFVEFSCRVSQRETHLTHQNEDPSVTQFKTHLASAGEFCEDQSTSETPKVAKHWEGCESSRLKGPVKPSRSLESQYTRPGNGYLFTTVIQHHSCASYPPTWHHPLSLAIFHRKTQRGEPSENENTNTQERSTSSTCQSPKTDGAVGLKSVLPESLPLRCPSPHMHRWNPGTSLPNEESHGGIATELVKVMWCQGIIYRIIGGTVPIIEISPGDGSVIRSNGVLVNYFTHHKAGCRPGDNMESTYYLSNLPPDVPGQKYSVSSVVTRASRVLECYNQAKDSLKLSYLNCCWRKEMSISEPPRLLQEAYMPDWGHFLAFSDGSAEITFLDGVKGHTMWTISDKTPARRLGLAHQMYSEVEQPCSWCQLTLPNGQKLLLQAKTAGPYHKYLSVSAEWCCWVQQTYLSPNQACSPQSVQVQSSKETQSRSVVAELEKIKRFNFLLDNSHLIRTHRSSSVPNENSRTSSGTSSTVGETGILEALQKTSKAIKDIEALLSQKEYASNSPLNKSSSIEKRKKWLCHLDWVLSNLPWVKILADYIMDSRGNIKNLMANFNTAPNPQTVTTHQTPAKPQAKMSVTLKTSSGGGAMYGSQSSSSSHSQKPTTQNISSDVLKLGAKFENLSNTEKTTFPKPPPLKPVAISKPLLPLSKSSPKTGSHTATSPVESSSGPTGSPKSPISGLKPKPVVASLQSKVVQENVQGDIQKNKVVKTMSANNPSFLLTQQTSFKEKSANFSAEHQKDINKPTSNSMPSKPPNVKPDLPKEKPDIADGSISKEKTTQDSAPKIKPLPNVFALGKCPSKPKRPPFVNLDRFTSISASINDLPPPLPIYVIPEDSEELNTAGQEESYDDVGTIQHQEQAGEDDEMYEDLEERWAENDQSDTRKEDKKKCDKEKKRFEQKKEQKVCEKKEREARKKFKLSGEIVVLQEAKARVDCKGGKNELSLTQREIIEIVRITDNPKGFWLGRNSEGLYGYVKTAALEVDHNALKVQSGQVPAEADEVYDDVGTPDGASMNDSFPPPPAVGAPPGDEVYDDVDSPLLPPPLPPANHPSVKAEEIDAKKKKKFEKEEKEFRKKFKYDGDISVLHQVIVDLALTSKKWGNKDLPLKPGEVIDVIVKPQDGKFIGRNKDGKLGYVCLLNIQQENEIYDDIGEDCIYDN